jgi:hypothetical protein
LSMQTNVRNFEDLIGVGGGWDALAT